MIVSEKFRTEEGAMMRKEKIVVVGGACLLGLSCIQLAQAQASEPPERLEEVIVTAQKREQSVQEVPQAVQVINADQLASASIHEFADLTRIARHWSSAGRAPGECLSVDSVASAHSRSALASSPASRFKWTMFRLRFKHAPFADLSDVQRIEVLRGPKGTLYGQGGVGRSHKHSDFWATESFEGNVHVLGTPMKSFVGGLGLSGPSATPCGIASRHSTRPTR